MEATSAKAVNGFAATAPRAMAAAAIHSFIHRGLVLAKWRRRRRWRNHFCQASTIDRLEPVGWRATIIVYVLGAALVPASWHTKLALALAPTAVGNCV